MWDEFGRRSPLELVLPIGASWAKVELNRKQVAGYRFFPKGFRGVRDYARIKRHLDISAALYVALVALSWLLQNRWTLSSASSVLVAISSAFTLSPLFAARLLQTRWGSVVPFFVFAIVNYCVLLHESRWLNEMIFIFRPPEGLFRSKTTFTRRQLVLTVASQILNYVVVLGIVLTAADYLWKLRFVPWARGTFQTPALLLGGLLLTVIGASKSVEAIDSDDAELWQRSLKVLLAAVLTGASFAAVMGLALRSGAPGATAGWCFGAAMALTAWSSRRFIVRPNQKRLPPKAEPWIRRFVFLPLIALGRGFDVLLGAFLRGVVHPLQVALISLFKPVLMVLDRILRNLPFEWLRGLRDWIGSCIDPPRPLTKLERMGSFEEKMRTEDGRVYGIMHQPKMPAPKIGVEVHVRSSLVRGLLAEDSWLTTWLKREPIRLLRGGMWQREDPLDFQRKVRIVTGIWPPTEDMDRLYRRLLSLMLATFAVAYVLELGAGHVVAHYGRPLLDSGPLYATIFGLVVGALFALVGILGHSSMAALTLGLVSGLSLDPMEGLAKGLVYRIAHGGVLFVVVFVLAQITDTQGRRSQFVIGLLIAAAGLYLLYLPRLT
jgi:hypothetical protein